MFQGLAFGVEGGVCVKAAAATSAAVQPQGVSAVSGGSYRMPGNFAAHAAQGTFGALRGPNYSGSYLEQLQAMARNLQGMMVCHEKLRLFAITTMVDSSASVASELARIP